MTTTPRLPTHVLTNLDRRALDDDETTRRRALSAELRRLRGTPDPPTPDPRYTARALRERAQQREDER